MKVYRKKPLEIEAVQYNGTNESLQRVLKFQNTFVSHAKNGDATIFVGDYKLNVGDWAVKEGETLYVYKSDAFEIAFSRKVVAPTVDVQSLK